MKKILLVQRGLTHYRRLLLQFVEEQGEFSIDILSISDKEETINNVHTFTATKLFQYKNYSIQRSEKLIAYVKNHYNDYDYIILEGATNLSNNIPIVKFLKSHNKPYVVWDAGRRKNSKMSIMRKMAQGQLEYVWKNASAIIAYSTLAKEYFLSIGIPDGKVFICQNTLNVGEFDEQIESLTDKQISEIRAQYAGKNGTMILYVGAVEPRKRIKDLIDAFDIVHLSYPNTSLVIIGGGDQLAELKEYSNSKENVYLLGQIIDGVIKYFMACDVFALPSEGGLSLNQAMICEKPIVASSADGTELDLIEDGKNGYLFEETNINDLADKIQLIIATPEMSKKMGRQSRRIIDERVNEKEFYRNFKECLNSLD